MSSSNFDYWHIKIIYDLAGYVAAFLVTLFFTKQVFRKNELPNPFHTKNEKREYMMYVISGAML